MSGCHISITRDGFSGQSFYNIYINNITITYCNIDSLDLTGAVLEPFHLKTPQQSAEGHIFKSYLCLISLCNARMTPLNHWGPFHPYKIIFRHAQRAACLTESDNDDAVDPP